MTKKEELLEAVRGLSDKYIDSVIAYAHREHRLQEYHKRMFLETAEGQGKPRCNHEEEVSLSSHSDFWRCKLLTDHSGHHKID